MRPSATKRATSWNFTWDELFLKYDIKGLKNRENLTTVSLSWTHRRRPLPHCVPHRRFPPLPPARVSHGPPSSSSPRQGTPAAAAARRATRRHHRAGSALPGAMPRWAMGATSGRRTAARRRRRRVGSPTSGAASPSDASVPSSGVLRGSAPASTVVAEGECRPGDHANLC
jgi:hypothetical protein